MKKLLLLPLLMLPFGAFASDVSKMSVEEVKAKHAELYNLAKNDLNEETCLDFYLFDQKAHKEKKLSIRDFAENEQYMDLIFPCGFNDSAYKKKHRL